MVQKLCWNCKFFNPTDPETQLGGICRRHAPRATDYNTIFYSQIESFAVAVGLLANDGLNTSGIIPLIDSGDQSLVPTCHVLDTKGLNDNGIMPIPCFKDFKVSRITVAASRMNSGLGSPASNISLRLQCVEVTGTNQSLLWQEDIPMNSSLVGDFNNTNDNFIESDSRLPESAVDQDRGLMGFRLDCTVGSNQYIGQVRNVKVGLLFERVQDLTNNPGLSQVAKWARIVDASKNFCGEFVPNHLDILTIPTP